MTKEEKGVLLDQLREKFAQNSYFYVMDAGGMSVAEVNQFRRFCYERGFEYRVFKNSLIKKALQSSNTDYAPFNEKVLKGFSGIIFTSESGSAPAKLIKEFRKKGGSDKLKLKGASVDASFFFGEESLEDLIKVKSKQDVIAELVGLLMSPAANLVSALKTPPQRLVSALQSGANNITGVLKTID